MPDMLKTTPNPGCTGNAYGLGDVRLREIRSASDALGIPDDQVTVLNHTLLQDGKQSEWDIDTISSVVTDFTTRHGIDTVCRLL